MIGAMGETPVHLVGLLPPDHVERILTDIKRSLFRASGLLSGLALGPIAAIGYHELPPPPPDRASLPRCPALAAAEWLLAEETLVLSVEPRGAFSELLHALALPQPGTAPKGAPVGERREPIPLLPGLYIARLDERPGAGRWSPVEEIGPQQSPDAIFASLPPPPRLTWSASRLVCWALRYRDPNRWWDAIVQEEVWAVRLGRES